MKKLIVLIFIFQSVYSFSQYTEFKSEELESWQQEFSEKTHKDIQDYYFLLPNKLFDCEEYKEFELEERINRITLKDIKNGYIDFEGSYNMSIALFKNRKILKDYIAISSNFSGRGSSCGSFNVILEYNQDSAKWYYRNDLLPKREIIKPYYDKFYKDPTDAHSYPVLPRQGLIIEFRDELQEGIILNVEWTGQEFKVISNAH